MLHRRLSPATLALLFTIIPLLLGSLQQPSILRQQQGCDCLNGGQCSQTDKYVACNCPSGFVGTKCQTPAAQITSIEKQVEINQGYSYFYFEPKEINYYQISLKICLPENQNKKLTNLVFLEVQRSSGKLKLQPSIYQTSPIIFQGKQDRCQTFYTHFIPIRKKLNDEFQKVIFGVSIKNNSDIAANRWVNFLQHSMANSEQALKTGQVFNTELSQNDPIIDQIQTQKITISCTYELYLVQNYWGTFIIIMSAVTLFVSTAVFLYTIRNKYSYTLSNEDILRLYAANPEDFVSNQRVKNDLSHFKLIMPMMSYELLIQKQKRALRKYPKNILKRRIQMHRQIDINESQNAQIQQSKNNDQKEHDLLSETLSVTKSQDSTISIENVCTICLLNFQKTEQIRQTPCKHVFHADCIDNWCQNTLNCPICRSNLDMPRFMTKRQFRNLIQS